MKPRFRFASLRPDSDARLPALLALLLLVLLVAQMTMRDDIALPVRGIAAGGGAGAPIAPPPAVAVPQSLLARQLFAPGAAGKPRGAADAPADPLDGLTVAGSVRVGRTVYAMVQWHGRTARLAPGGVVNGWRLVALRPDGAVFSRGRERLTRAFGAATPSSPSAPDGSKESQ